MACDSDVMEWWWALSTSTLIPLSGIGIAEVTQAREIEIV
jgi:hypothetical protein